MKQLFEEYGMIFIAMGLVAVFLLVCGPVGNYFEERGSTSIEQYCVVEDKHTSTVMVGRVATTRHYLDVYVEDAEELRDSVLVTGALYNEIEIGTEVKCVITYKDDEFLGIDIIE